MLHVIAAIAIGGLVGLAIDRSKIRREGSKALEDRDKSARADERSKVEAEMTARHDAAKVKAERDELADLRRERDIAARRGGSAS